MTQTTQPRSLVTLNKTENKPETEDNVKLLRECCNNMNELYESLCRLSDFMDKKIAEKF